MMWLYRDAHYFGHAHRLPLRVAAPDPRFGFGGGGGGGRFYTGGAALTINVCELSSLSA